MSVLFIPLVILFFLMIKEQYTPVPVPVEAPKELSAEERRAAFALKFGLTRREEEISAFLSEGHSNGEIAAYFVNIIYHPETPSAFTR